MSYQRTPLTAPVLSGFGLKAFASVVSTFVAAPIREQTLVQLGVKALRDTPVDDGFSVADPPLPFPNPLPEPRLGVDLAALAIASTVTGSSAGPFRTVADFHQAYRSKSTTPVEVAERVVAATAAFDAAARPLRAFIAQNPDDIRRQAQASADRWAENRPLSVFDGVPVPIKDEVWVKGYPTTGGTSFLGRDIALKDATVVARLRAAGAVLIGKTNMHEFGLGVTGVNPHHGPSRNPYGLGHITGGSSSGTAAAVGAGLAPVGLGADGGGSIRIPAGLCGLVGLKPTFGRVSEYGALDICWSVAHLGPIGATVADVAAFYSIIAGPDPADSRSCHAPPVDLGQLKAKDLEGVRIGVDWTWFEDAEASVVEGCRALLDGLVSRGAIVKNIEVPDVALAKTAHMVIIVTEMLTAAHRYGRQSRSKFGLDVQINFALGQTLSGFDYAHARRHRSALTAAFLETMSHVDVIATPTTGCTAPLMPEHALPNGESNLPQLERISRFSALANLSGFPAIALPAGHNQAGLPVSCQFMGRPWSEALLFRVGRVAEDCVERTVPRAHVDLLG